MIKDKCYDCIYEKICDAWAFSNVSTDGDGVSTRYYIWNHSEEKCELRTTKQ